ncbi:MAG: hypothetical protein Q4C56_07835 [Peptococcaceae bacterium]|nr:hypothetical protein [Peptococcaceae bacterium]
METNHEQEIQEAIYAGRRAKSSLRRAQQALDSAGNWGIADMIGGGLISGVVKHSRLGDSRREMANARRDLQRFRRELADISEQVPDLDIGSFLTFADFAFDGLIADALVQSKISKARSQVATAIHKVDAMLRRLESLQ